tara:strand:+ start:955 stop:1293 length:339 start_codon:yes stop_codon:yes gene_type:complete
MPTSRKRIGFLPNEEVQNIIDRICLKSNLSQSKVTGMLVEEALHARNLYSVNRENELKEIYYEKDSQNDKIKKNIKSITNKNMSEDKEYKLIREYLDYKNFKKILSDIQSER